MIDESSVISRCSVCKATENVRFRVDRFKYAKKPIDFCQTCFDVFCKLDHQEGEREERMQQLMRQEFEQSIITTIREYRDLDEEEPYVPS